MTEPHIVCCATEAGGARNLEPVILELEGRCNCAVAASRTTLPFFGAFGSTAEIVSLRSEAEAVAFLQDARATHVLCGTARLGGAERFMTAAAGKLGISSVAVLDEWYSYRYRFADENNHLCMLPDAICCQDALARREAAGEGLPAERLHVTGSPALAGLTDQAELFCDSAPEAPSCMGGAGPAPVITFLSETHAADYGKSPGACGPLGDYLGYTEETVRNDIFSVIRELGLQLTVIEKLHPCAQATAPPPGDNAQIQWRAYRDVELWPLLWHSDLVIGMQSMALLEAAILGCPAVSYQPGLIGREMCTAVRLRLVEKLENREALKSLIDNLPMSSPHTVRRFPFALAQAAENVIKVLLSGKSGAL